MYEIREVIFTPEVTDKLWSKHRLAQAEVEEVIFDPSSEIRWDESYKHGPRLVVRGSLGDPARQIFLALRPVEDDPGVWRCVTAFEPTRDDYGTNE